MSLSGISNSESSDGADWRLCFEASHYVLCAAYFFISLLSLVSLVRRLLHAVVLAPPPSQQPPPAASQNSMRGTWGLFFHIFFLLGCFGRIAYFLFDALSPAPTPEASTPKLLFSWVPTFCFFSCFWIILALWVELYHARGLGSGRRTHSTQGMDVLAASLAAGGGSSGVTTSAAVAEDAAARLHRRQHRILVLLQTVTGLMLGIFGLCVLIYALSLAVDVGFDLEIRVALHCVTISIYIILASGYTVYGSLIARKMCTQLESWSGGLDQATFSVLSRRTRGVLLRVIVIAAVCTAAFSFRAAFIIWQLVQNIDVSEMFWWMDVAYYPLLEALPLSLVLMLLSHAHEKKSSNHAEDASAPLLGERDNIGGFGGGGGGGSSFGSTPINYTEYIS